MELSGLMIYYYFVCKRKLWYFCNDITMEQNSEIVEIGKILHDDSYKRENKSISINNTINIDFIDNKMILHEIKKSKSIEEAGIWQLKYYMYYLEKNGISNVQGEIDYPLIREKKKLMLKDTDKIILNDVEMEIKKILMLNKPPRLIGTKNCRKCAYFDLCYI